MKQVLILFLVHLTILIHAQIPSGYYDDADGQTGFTLKTSLHTIIDDHADQGYGALWDLYEISDVRADGKVWDIYADCDFTFVTDQDSGSGGTVECDKFNREHTFPQSWFGGSGTMRNDPFHVLPTDKKVNSVRGNFAYGVVSSPTYTSGNGSKLGLNTYSGYSGTVFEPIDEYKGDIARGYFYMATRYEDQIAAWENNDSDGDGMLNGTSNQVFESWALEMLIEWHTNDPVSQKEIDRNDAIYDFQGNRNPFIDHPEYVACIWESNCGGGSMPSINVNESITDFGTIAFGNVSSSQSYTVSGSDLTGDLTITASDSYQLSENDTDFSSSIVLSPTSGSVSSTAIFVRFNPTSDSDATVNGTITHSSDGASNQVINVSGVEESDITPPTLSITESLIDFGQINFGEASNAQSYILNADNLTADLIISTSESFEISEEDVEASYTNSLSLTPTSGSISDKTIFIRFNPTNNANVEILGTVSHSSAGLAEQTIDVSGTETPDAPEIAEINFNLTQLTIRDNNTYTVNLFADVAPANDFDYTINQNGLVNVSEEDFITFPELINGNIPLVWKSGTTSSSFDIQIINESILMESSDKSIGFTINSSASNDYTIGTNSTVSIIVEGNAVTNTENKINTELLTYPNPANNELVVAYNGQKYDYSIINLTGKTVLKNSGLNTSLIDVSNLKTGSYILLVQTENTVLQRKIIIQ